MEHRVHGTLSSWNDERGFGFITMAQRDEQVFMHVSAFARDGACPRIGALVSFRVQAGPDGRKRAVDVQRPGMSRVSRLPTVRRTNRAPAVLWTLLAGAVIGVWSVYAFRSLGARQDVLRTSPRVDPVDVAAPIVGEPAFKCDNRTRCRQMTSCEEARYFLKNCGHVNIDGDLDGVPCEVQWCGKQ